MKKKILAFFLTFLLFASFQLPYAFAHSSAAEHWRDMSVALFGYNLDLRGKPQKIREAIFKLRYATQLCIDQFDNNSKSYLTRLHQLKVPRLPDTISEINLNANATNHRKPTHQGWDFNYKSCNSGSNKNWSTVIWPRRKKLMLTTAEHVFNFNGFPDGIDHFLSPTSKCDAFCAILYYIHLLGDHNEFTYTNYINEKNDIIPLASSRNVCLISEFKKYFSILFGEEKSYDINKELDEINQELCSLLLSKEKLTEESFAEYHHATEIILNDILAKHLPQLLKGEEFFNSIFSAYLPGP